jgi:hypothetical protein
MCFIQFYMVCIYSEKECELIRESALETTKFVGSGSLYLTAWDIPKVVVNIRWEFEF